MDRSVYNKVKLIREVLHSQRAVHIAWFLKNGKGKGAVPQRASMGA